MEDGLPTSKNVPVILSVPVSNSSDVLDLNRWSLKVRGKFSKDRKNKIRRSCTNAPLLE